MRVYKLSIYGFGDARVKDRFEIAAELRVIGRLLTIKGENPFKVQAYERGARALWKLSTAISISSLKLDA